MQTDQTRLSLLPDWENTNFYSFCVGNNGEWIFIAFFFFFGLFKFKKSYHISRYFSICDSRIMMVTYCSLIYFKFVCNSSCMLYFSCLSCVLWAVVTRTFPRCGIIKVLSFGNYPLMYCRDGTMSASLGTPLSFVESLGSRFLEKCSGDRTSLSMRCEPAAHTDIKCSLWKDTQKQNTL